MSKKLPNTIQNKIEKSLTTVGDMALRRRAKRITEELELKDGDEILEIGCGNGYYLSLLNRLGIKLNLIGIDNDKSALFDAKRFISDDRVKLIFSNAEKLPFKDKTFDKIVISEVIEHVKNEQVVLHEAFRVLKKSGILALTTCNIDYPFLWDPVNWILQHTFKIHIKSGFWAGIWNQHLRLYKKKDVEKMVEEADFNVHLSENLTSWCLPFNHYLINFIAILFYNNQLPANLAKSMNKFQNNKQPFLIRSGFYLINLVDKLNDLFPQDFGVSIYIKATK